QYREELAAQLLPEDEPEMSPREAYGIAYHLFDLFSRALQRELPDAPALHPRVPLSVEPWLVGEGTNLEVLPEDGVLPADLRAKLAAMGASEVLPILWEHPEPTPPPPPVVQMVVDVPAGREMWTRVLEGLAKEEPDGVANYQSLCRAWLEGGEGPEEAAAVATMLFERARQLFEDQIGSRSAALYEGVGGSGLQHCLKVETNPEYAFEVSNLFVAPFEFTSGHASLARIMANAEEEPAKDRRWTKVLVVAGLLLFLVAFLGVIALLVLVSILLS
ncbi:MAG: hypothetical protein HN348_15075, partial [Proteobacteria bacterium]|nr:hypothetical protein [Pseudomonadota bacterium]